MNINLYAPLRAICKFLDFILAKFIDFTDSFVVTVVFFDASTTTKVYEIHKFLKL